LNPLLMKLFNEAGVNIKKVKNNIIPHVSVITPCGFLFIVEDKDNWWLSNEHAAVTYDKESFQFYIKRYNVIYF